MGKHLLDGNGDHAYQYQHLITVVFMYLQLIYRCMLHINVLYIVAALLTVSEICIHCGSEKYGLWPYDGIVAGVNC